MHASVPGWWLWPRLSKLGMLSSSTKHVVKARSTELAVLANSISCLFQYLISQVQGARPPMPRGILELSQGWECSLKVWVGPEVTTATAALD